MRTTTTSSTSLSPSSRLRWNHHPLYALSRPPSNGTKRSMTWQAKFGPRFTNPVIIPTQKVGWVTLAFEGSERMIALWVGLPSRPNRNLSWRFRDWFFGRSLNVGTKRYGHRFERYRHRGNSSPRLTKDQRTCSKNQQTFSVSNGTMGVIAN